VDQKADVKFSCIANGYPAPVIAWHFTNNDLINYSCVAVNKKNKTLAKKNLIKS